MIGILLLALVFDFIVGAIGSSRKIGFFPAFLLSLLLSPIIGLIIVLCSERKSDAEFKQAMMQQAIQNQKPQPPAGEKDYKCKQCGYQSDTYTPFCPQCGAH
ncbi:hypothetical protein SDC9_46866 [bioreactor metagenome]|uniref:Uncharacterized protein n=1 Tax=bioreactor metagenome TaxID=1076179 RepID=A0A644WAV1_9ZZZZ